MSIRFRKSLTLAKGVRLNFSKRGVGISAGIKGARIGIGSRGLYTSTSLPGTGLYSVNYLGQGKKGSNNGSVSLSKNDQSIVIKVLLGSLFIIALLISPPLGVLLLIGIFIYYYRRNKSPIYQSGQKCKKAAILFKQGEYPQAETLLYEARELSSENKEATYLLGLTLNNQQKFKEAIEYLEEASSYYPDNESIIMALGSCYFNTGEFDKTIALIQKYPNWESNLKAIQILGLSFANQKKYNLAIEVFKKAPLKKQIMDSDLIDTHYNFGNVYAAAGDRENALKHFNRVYAYNANYKDASKKIEKLEKIDSSASVV